MKILFIIDRLNLGGAERHTMTLAAGLATKGHDVHCWVLLAGGSVDFPVSGFPTAPQHFQGKSLLSPNLWLALHRQMRLLEPDLVVGVNQSATFVARLLAALSAVPFRLTSIFHTTIIGSFVGTCKLQLYRWSLRKADALVYVSKLQCEYWSRKGLPIRIANVITNGISASRFVEARATRRQTSRLALGLGEHHLAAMIVARFAPEKNHQWLIDCTAKMVAEAPELRTTLRIVMIGEGPLRPALEQQIQKLQLQDIFHFTGPVSDVSTLLPAGDVGLLISKAVETFSLAALELMASSMPMLMTNIGGAAEVIEDGIQGFLIPVGDDRRLLEAFRAVLERSAFERMGASAQARVLAKFTLDEMIANYDSLFRRVQASVGSVAS